MRKCRTASIDEHLKVEVKRSENTDRLGLTERDNIVTEFRSSGQAIISVKACAISKSLRMEVTPTRNRTPGSISSPPPRRPANSTCADLSASRRGPPPPLPPQPRGAMAAWSCVLAAPRPRRSHPLAGYARPVWPRAPDAPRRLKRGDLARPFPCGHVRTPPL